MERQYQIPTQDLNTFAKDPIGQRMIQLSVEYSSLSGDSKTNHENYTSGGNTVNENSVEVIEPDHPIL